ncbi:MAG: hypothetical protein RLZZ546_3389, partial [Bacteroidota bacterium]
NPSEYLNSLKNNNGAFGQNIPFDLEKFNGRPMFRGMAKQNFDPDNGDRTLEMFTGVSKVHQEKSTVEQIFEPMQTRFPNQELIDRDAVRVTDIQNGITPFDQIYTTPFPSLSVRPETKTIDELKKYEVVPVTSQFNTSNSKTKIQTSLGEETRNVLNNVFESRSGPAKYNIGTRNQGGETSLFNRDNIGDPFDSTMIPGPKSIHDRNVLNGIKQSDTRIHTKDLVEDIMRFGNVSSERRMQIRSNLDVPMNERGDVVEDNRYNVKSKHKRQIVADTYVPATLRQGNVFEHFPNPNNSRQGRSIDPKIENVRDKDFIEVSTIPGVKGKQRYHNTNMTESRYEDNNPMDVDDFSRLTQRVSGAKAQSRNNDTLINWY